MKTFFKSFQARSFQSRLLGCFLVIAALSMLVPIFYVRPVLHEAMLKDSLERLGQDALLVGTLLERRQDDAELSAVSALLNQTDIRLTLMNPQGDVLFESSQPDKILPENHADRPEVQKAMRSGQGSARRFSATLQYELIYAALRLENGRIIRLAVPFAGVKQRIDAQVAGFFLAAATAVALSLLLAWFFSRRIQHSLSCMIRIVEDISLGKFSRRLHAIPGKEFQALADAVNRMAESIEGSILTVADQRTQLEAILETMAEGVLVLGPKGRVRRINKAFAAYFPQSGPVEGRQVVELIPSHTLQEAVLVLMADPAGYGKSTVLQITVNKAVFSVLLARPLEEAADSLGLVAVFRDITELVRLETVRRDFVANVSHELRTPLTAIQGYAETLAGMEGIPEEGHRFAEIIRKHSVFLSVMVDELLALSRLESEGFRLRCSPVRPAEVLHRATQVVQAEVERKRLSIGNMIAPELLVQADAALLERLFRNLLENACRYAPEGSEILVSAETKGREAVFTVADQGPGIPSAELGRIFERFYQVEKYSGASKGIGGGLGLAICKHIVERHHGRIWAESPSEKAATAFFFTLPVTVSDSCGENQ